MKKKSLEELHRPDIEEYKASAKIPLVVVLDNIRSGLNVGSVFRTADAFSVRKVYLCGISAIPPHREILKTALGAENSVAWEYTSSTLDCVKRLKKEGYFISVVEQAHHSAKLNEYNFKANKEYALVFGNEVRGINEELLALADNAIEVPQTGTKHSLNIAVCSGILIWEFWRQQQSC